MNNQTFKKLLSIFVLAIVTPAHAEWKTPTAGEVSELCKLERTNQEDSRTRFALCSMPIKGFIDGYKRGAAKGMRTAFIEDAKNLATVQGIQDLQNRASVLRARSECMPPAATADQVEQVFINFVRQHPELKNSEYPAVLSDAIEEYFCPAR